MPKCLIHLSLDCAHVSAHYCCKLVYPTVCAVVNKVTKREKKAWEKKFPAFAQLHNFYMYIVSFRRKKSTALINNWFNYDFADSLACHYRGMSYLPVPQQLWPHDLQAPCNFTLHSVTRTGALLNIFKENIQLKATDFY